MPYLPDHLAAGREVCRRGRSQRNQPNDHCGHSEYHSAHVGTPMNSDCD
jgi:hypothetical protein